MITTSDVMVGDWVRITIEGEQYPAVVNSIKLNTEEIGVSFLAAPGDWEDGDGYDEIEPIPLTAEILAQNGFSKSRLMGEQRHFTYYLGPSLSMLAIYDADFSVHIGDGARYVKNVHQLQHILKVCGIEKEIVIKN